MPRARNKDDLLLQANENYNKMRQLIENMESELEIPFDFSNDESKKEAHRTRDKNLRDILAHLYEWQILMINFVKNNLDSDNNFPFLPSPYNRKTYGIMNQSFREKHQQTSLDEIKLKLKETHNKCISLIESFSNEELFTKKYYSRTGTTDLGSYFVSSTASHYDWAIKKLKAHQKNCKK